LNRLNRGSNQRAVSASKIGKKLNSFGFNRFETMVQEKREGKTVALCRIRPSLEDGLHMASHAAALGISAFAYAGDHT
jgi:hypothetical protein